MSFGGRAGLCGGRSCLADERDRTMRRIINSTYITLDGVIENPQDWPSGRHEGDTRVGEIQTELLLGCDALLLGRRTYEGFAPVWTAMSGDPHSDHINAMEKWVVSRTVTTRRGTTPRSSARTWSRRSAGARPKRAATSCSTASGP